MSKTIIATASAPAAIGPYSQAVKTGNLLFCSGQLGLDPVSGNLKDGLRAQAEQAMRNLQAVIGAAGGTLDNIVKTTIFLTTMDNFPTVNEVYGACFPADKPARSTIAVAGLPKGGLVEIEAIVSL
ncbi:MAG: reactive intermediate/imine deaminase [Spirochaetes bacterium GWD1_61_31]|nr:MAG: reactive intermediate/imine deaminase [Spirochaetes bacterium GWB1_60_80]OHD32794.1 MAG: reactive intermediate/imine deaminase [Spirochaetes bacterium GWC1_61_12]OHD35367.1 MAG: reactive intermediate/imine deaminase [Spirochaetes bacterium GWD1_61_31]OHD42490.1 MAG: reactive intermediate/imine deaminase [Spirochaetes bacterium GWE1_60_18]OHD58218.1 MAG: reactive intermediate/imine deaminase [Spirochaetes bacterium GWF1_60_12]HAP42926.1 reactive intermediate/imine deaminase [Spirochaeta